MVILPGTHVTPTTLKERIKMEEVGSTQEEDQEIFNGLIDLGTGETEIENRKKLKELGPSLAFLHRFNDHVLEDNQAFPSMYRLIKRYHTDHHYIMEKREEKFVKIDSAQLDKRMPEKDSSNTKESYAEKLEKGKAE